MSEQSMTDLITELGKLRQRLDAGWIALMMHAQESPGDRAWERQADAKYEAIAERYVANVWRLAAMPRRQVMAAGAALLERLERGWLMEPSERVDQETIDQGFAILLARYEAVCDALRDPHDVRGQHQQKLDAVRSARRYKVQSVA